MTPTLEATMRRLCELEPERFEVGFQVVQRHDDYTRHFVISVSVRFGTPPLQTSSFAYLECDDPAELAADQGIILAAVMAAIETRGWRWTIGFDLWRKFHFARVWSNEGSFEQPGVLSALHALALAYVQALEAEQAGGEG
jgi:hypothetical protein